MTPIGNKRIERNVLGLLFVGVLVGFTATSASGCQESCAERDCPAPIKLASGNFSVDTEKRSFEEVQPPNDLPDLSSASIEMDAENKKVTLSYRDSLGEPVKVTFEERADGGGAGEGGL